ncbi:MAG TPA: S1/P1 Nuclease [Phenylobacterium sp.]|uniref:S1/P1 Nuclease n=1 Tax=Phenylobacterium sp. TaxID=1871053 RepID=UPI002D6A554D|nr:S1/P1 Nuclease [Phenylobacterium sp.]HZZ68339.1 S1/P1 Nuclease [Phenylobacterium sp.]
MKRLAPFALAAALTALVPNSVLAWGSAGHRIIVEAAMRALPASLPAFLRTPKAALDVGEYSREPDRGKGAGREYDSDRDPGHFLDLSDDGTVLGGPKLTALPLTRPDYEKALQAVNQSSWKAGYLPYSIVDRYQQLAHDFAYWRVLTAAEANPAFAAHRAWFAADRQRREAQILIAIGELSHFVGDGSQPLHMTVHFNGWGDFPNPAGYTTAKIHSPFESDLVEASVTEAGVVAKMAPPSTISEPVEQHVVGYLAATGAQVIPLYELEKAGGMAPGDPRGPAFATRQIAIGASELRDMIVLAWQASERQTVGYKPVSVADVLAGKVDPYNALYGID